MLINTYLSIITLNFNELSAPIKDTEWQAIYKVRAYNMLPIRDPFQGEGNPQIESEEIEKDTFHVNGNDRKAGVQYSHQTKQTLKQRPLKDLNIRYDTIKLLEESTGKIFPDINRSNVFLGQSPKAIKINKWD